MSRQIHLFCDQDAHATGAFYKAFGQAVTQHVSVSCSVDRPGIKYHYLDLGKVEHHPNKVARMVAFNTEPGDLVVIARDIEDRSDELVEKHLDEIRRALASEGVPATSVHFLIIKPLTEAVYLLDDGMRNAALGYFRRNPPSGRRRRWNESDVLALAVDRRLHARKPERPCPSKDRFERVLPVRDSDKAKLAAEIGNVVSHAAYTLPSKGTIVTLDALVAWLEGHLRPVNL